jgi:hypothetical protein
VDELSGYSLRQHLVSGIKERAGADKAISLTIFQKEK